MKSISIEELHQQLGSKEAMQGAIVIDVRTPEEYAQGHIPTAVNKPLDKFALYEDSLKVYTRVYVHCRTGGRSSQACARLGQLGHGEVYNIEGGVQAWERAGYPVEKTKANDVQLKQPMLAKEFLAFLKEYKVAVLAIAFVMGTATDTLVKSIVNNLIMPFFNPLLTTSWRESTVGVGPFEFGLGAFTADALHFLILAFVIFVVVKRIMKLDTIPGKK